MMTAPPSSLKPAQATASRPAPHMTARPGYPVAIRSALDLPVTKLR